MEGNKLKIISSKHDINQLAKQLKASGKSIGFVPTMGFLHEGHLALVKEARQENDCVIMSIFVNPLQFGPSEDYDMYPRDAERDKKLAKEAGVDILFMPSVDEMYKKKQSIKMMVTERTNRLCGAKRPMHFNGVVMVLTKLFHLTIPDRAYFGLKDAQQFAIVSALVDDFDFSVEIVPVNTVREPSGLAISSRNVYLTAEERQKAPALYHSLLLGKKRIVEGETDVTVITDAVNDYLYQHLTAKIDYVELLSFPELETISVASGNMILAAAIQFSAARLIDNIIMES
jgi:pantoate--beta-alanine ligase